MQGTRLGLVRSRVTDSRTCLRHLFVLRTHLRVTEDVISVTDVRVAVRVVCVGAVQVLASSAVQKLELTLQKSSIIQFRLRSCDHVHAGEEGVGGFEPASG